MLETFLDIVNNASGAGERIFREWTSNPGKFLKRPGLPIDKLLLSLTEEEKAKCAPLIAFFTGASFLLLFKALEEGESVYSFELTMKNAETGEVFSLINEDSDNEIRDRFNRR